MQCCMPMRCNSDDDVICVCTCECCTSSRCGLSGHCASLFSEEMAVIAGQKPRLENMRKWLPFYQFCVIFPENPILALEEIRWNCSSVYFYLPQDMPRYYLRSALSIPRPSDSPTPLWCCAPILAGSHLAVLFKPEKI